MLLTPVGSGRLVNGGHVLFSVSGAYGFVEVGGGSLAYRQAQPAGPGGVEHEARVLARQVSGEARRELFLDHHLALYLGIRQAQWPALDNLEELRGVHADGLGKRDRLGQHAEDAHDPVVGNQLEAAAGAGGPEPQGVAAHRIEDGLALRLNLLRTRGEHYKLPLLGRLLRPQNRGIHVENAALPGYLRKPLVALNTDRTHLQPHAVVGQRRQRTVLTINRLRDSVAVREHRQQKPGTRGGLGGGIRHLRSIVRHLLVSLSRNRWLERVHPP